MDLVRGDLSHSCRVQLDSSYLSTEKCKLDYKQAMNKFLMHINKTDVLKEDIAQISILSTQYKLLV